MKSSSNSLKLPTITTSSISKRQIKSIPIEFVKKEDDDIVFLEEKPSSSKIDKKDEAMKTSVATVSTENTFTASVDDKETSEFIFNYSQDNEDIDFDSDDELISIFDMCDKTVNNDKIVNSNVKNPASNSESDSESDDDIKFIMDKNNAFFNKIDSILIDLTNEDVHDTVYNLPKTSKSANRSISPIVIADTDIKLAQSKLSFNTENSKQKPKKASASDINKFIVNEENSSNDELLCEIAQAVELKHNSAKKNLSNETKSTSTTITDNNSLCPNSNKLKHFHKIIIKPLDLPQPLEIKHKEELPKMVPPKEKNSEAIRTLEPPDQNLSASKRALINFKRLRELSDDESSDKNCIKENLIANISKPLTSRNEADNSRKIKLIKSFSSSSEDENCGKSKSPDQACTPKSKLGFLKSIPKLPEPVANSVSKPISNLMKQFEKSPVTSSSKIKSISDQLTTNKVSNLSCNQTAGANIQIKRATQLINPPVVFKRPKLSSFDNSAELVQSEKEMKEPAENENITCLSSSEENGIPMLNSVDMKKKLALEKISKKKKLNPVASISNKAYEELKKQKFKEKDLLLTRISKKTTTTADELSLTQQINLGKIENMARIQKMNELRQQQQAQDSSDIVSAKPSKSSSFIQVSENNLPSKLLETKTNLKTVSYKPVAKQTKDKPKSNANLSSEPKSKEMFSSNTNSHGSLKENNLQKNDLVGAIMINMSNQNFNNQNLSTKPNASSDFRYSIDNFIARIVTWRFVWLIEQEKFHQKNFAQKNLPNVPIVNDNELMPIVEKYVNYDEYFKTIFPFLLLETWEEISRAYRDNLYNKKNKRYNDIPIWIKEIDKRGSYNEMNILVCQTLIEENSRTNFDEDILKLVLPIVDPSNRDNSIQTDCFAIIKKSVRLREGDSCILDAIKDYTKNLSNTNQTKNNGQTAQAYTETSPFKSVCNDDRKNKFIIFELHIQIKERRYFLKPNAIIDYELLTNLSSSFRRIKALAAFKNSSILKSILSPSVNDHVYISSKNQNQNFVFKNITEYNESQKEVIIEASAIITSKDAKFYFVQGPPGTGKTRTIVGIVQAMIDRSNAVTTNFSTTNDQKKGPRTNKLKIMICSPSNAGCDEIVRRLCCSKDIFVVRVGVNSALTTDNEKIDFNSLVKKKFQDLLNKELCKKSSSLRGQNETFRSKESLFRKRLKELKAAAKPDPNAIKNNEIMLEEILKRKKEFDEVLKKTNANTELSSADKKKLEQSAKELVLKEADVIVCTLNYSGNRVLDCLTMEKNKGCTAIDVIIIDEASQCLEVDFLIPMRFSCNKVIQVGDPEQLPATVCSTRAQDLKFQKSFFERIYHNFFFEDNNPIKMLHIQYRMHPEICAFPSSNFYRGKLITHAETIAKRKKSRLVPYLIFDIPHSQEKGEDDSVQNKIEAEELVDFYKIIRKKHQDKSIGIITPYQKQLNLINSIISEKGLIKAEVGTVDSFQGREKDIILFSSVRANSKNTIGFVSNKQRLNVSLTRAQYALYIFCNQKTLRSNKNWDDCFNDALKRNCIFTLSVKTNQNSI